MVTMTDVARRAGVSVTTVSHVLNGTRAVSPRTERAVRDAVEQTGYVSDGLARSLRTGTTHTIGLAMSAISNPYFAEVVHAIEREAGAAGYSLLLAETHDEAVSEARAVTDVLGRRVDAVVLAPSAQPTAALTAARRRKVPVVLIDRLLDEPLDQVGVANEEPTAHLVEHLAGHGHERIGFVAGRPGLSTSEERLQGYRIGLERSGLDADPALVVTGNSDDECARQAVDALLASPRPPTAVVAGNNLMTIGALRALGARGLRVPDDTALVAFDDFPWADLFSPRLTVMAQPTREMGRTAVSMLLERLGGGGGDPRQVRLEPTFVRRDSCGCA